jgi:hypothetical protein
MLWRQKANRDRCRHFIPTRYSYHENFQGPRVQIKIEIYKLKKIPFIYTVELANTVRYKQTVQTESWRLRQQNWPPCTGTEGEHCT